ncbi:MAG: polymerase [Phenylobacterium zucineum]|nr:MAG: polymerase [Phenylobacterium zucineum]
MSGWSLTGVFLVAPLIAWLGPLAFAPLVTLAGLLAVPTYRIDDADRPAAIAILVLVVWACVSTVWSPYIPKTIWQSTAGKLVIECVVYGALVIAARQGSPRSRHGLMLALVFGMSLLGILMLAEAATGAGIYQHLRLWTGDPIRPDLAVKNVAQGLFILTLFAPPAIVAGRGLGLSYWAAVPILAGIVWPAHVFGYDAPLVALVAAGLAMGLVWVSPRVGPRVLAGLAAVFFLTAPAVVWGVRRIGWYDLLRAKVSLSWSERMGYWAHAQEWISDDPARGWGLDASRMFGPGIQLHPHDAALQVWLELGLIGAVAAAVVWVSIFASLYRPRPDVQVAAGAGCGAVYLTFNAFSLGVWQEWWVALGAMACAICIALQRQALT